MTSLSTSVDNQAHKHITHTHSLIIYALFHTYVTITVCQEGIFFLFVRAFPSHFLPLSHAHPPYPLPPSPFHVPASHSNPCIRLTTAVPSLPSFVPLAHPSSRKFISSPASLKSTSTTPTCTTPPSFPPSFSSYFFSPNGSALSWISICFSRCRSQEGDSGPPTSACISMRLITRSQGFSASKSASSFSSFT